jgi:hypothetical protein
MDEKKISEFLRSFVATAKYAAANPARAGEAWELFRSDYGLDDAQLNDMLLASVEIRLGNPTAATS